MSRARLVGVAGFWRHSATYAVFTATLFNIFFWIKGSAEDLIELYRQIRMNGYQSLAIYP